MFQLRFHVNQHRVTAADDERNIGLELLELCPRRVARNPRRIKMRLMMMNTNERLAQRVGDGLAGFEADDQRGGQSRTLRRGNSIQLRRRDASFVQRRCGYGEKIPQMFARGQFRHDATVFGVKLNLRGNHRCADAPIRDHRRTGFVTGSFKR